MPFLRIGIPMFDRLGAAHRMHASAIAARAT